jgi:hypothetical protein
MALSPVFRGDSTPISCGRRDPYTTCATRIDNQGEEKSNLHGAEKKGLAPGDIRMP